ncbi:serine/threonine-protein kinase (plasmid) [Streptomyces europaeiscabiei]|uniref:serine/threonine-protein kinase n=1 Tax=Streptomyces europaeiscabiei TaxID=146819 RepID=UPI002E81278B|nr:serine/threonine-protein kinase [Streptomyces europaeiscabiei]WUD38879.1 serine/threonine-protein kinase [Streptomyces europaeiscabiei]
MAQRVIAGRYELQQLLGRGGMGEVWAARDGVMERCVAVKLLQPHLGTAEGEELFFREARTAGALSHPGVVTVHDLGRDGDGTLYLVMENVPGRNLGVVLKDGLPPVADALAWTAQVADALQAAHSARILHRDLKPANLMLTPAGSVKILDFGIARYISTLTGATRAIGTVAYMPPERLMGKVGDARGDLYALGCVLYELLTGRTPFGDLDTPAALAYAHVHTPSAPPSSHRPDLSPHLDALLAELLAKQPGDRPASATDVRDRLSHPPASSPPGPPSALRADPSHRLVGAATGGLWPPPTRLAMTKPSHQPWIYTTGDWVRSSPAVVDGTVYIGSDGKVYALDAATGTPRWTHTTSDSAWTHILTALWTASSPAVVDGTVYIGSNDHKVYALDAATGTPRWTHTASGWLYSSPAVVDGTVYIGSSDGKVYALDAATGTPRWTHTTGRAVRPSPAVVDGTVYIGSDDEKVYALDAATGTPRWTHTTSGWIHSSPAVVDGTVYIGSNDHKVYALDAATGTPRWTHTTSGWIHSSPAVVDGTVYIGSNDHKVYALDAATGTPRWTHTTGNAVQSSPAVVDGTVYIGSNDHKVYALDAATGTPRWTHTTGNAVQSSPAVVGGTVYIGSNDHKVYALDAATGQNGAP